MAKAAIPFRGFEPTSGFSDDFAYPPGPLVGRGLWVTDGFGPSLRVDALGVFNNSPTDTQQGTVLDTGVDASGDWVMSLIVQRDTATDADTNQVLQIRFGDVGLQDCIIQVQCLGGTPNTTINIIDNVGLDTGDVDLLEDVDHTVDFAFTGGVFTVTVDGTLVVSRVCASLPTGSGLNVNISPETMTRWTLRAITLG